jgi:lipopolysaccharide transport system ATP-binding protein
MPVVRVENLSKEYIIGRREAASESFREMLSRSLSSPFRRLRRLGGHAAAEERFWALRDVSFEVESGEVVGIIGRNGAGKSTLLKILSRITAPTTGRAELRGRVGSLLEVGTGFHPELTGRENIYLNGAILGMSKAEVRRKFDEIVDFSDVEKFLDTPVKRYSSGMYVRLAFAVAAHLESEILIIDEVLAVGDANFQRKCLGKMKDVSEGGRTVLFVSHQMAAVKKLCNRTVWFDQGIVVAEGETEDVIGTYLGHVSKLSHIPLRDRSDRRGSGDLRFVSVVLEDEKGRLVTGLRSGKDAVLVIRYENLSGRDLKDVQIAVGIDNPLGERIAWIGNTLTDDVFRCLPADQNDIEIHLRRLPLTAGRYGYTLYCTVGGNVADWVQNAGFFDVLQGDFYGTGKMPPPRQGNYLLDFQFHVRGRPVYESGA